MGRREEEAMYALLSVVGRDVSNILGGVLCFYVLLLLQCNVAFALAIWTPRTWSIPPSLKSVDTFVDDLIKGLLTIGILKPSCRRLYHFSSCTTDMIYLFPIDVWFSCYEIIEPMFNFFPNLVSDITVLEKPLTFALFNTLRFPSMGCLEVGCTCWFFRHPIHIGWSEKRNERLCFCLFFLKVQPLLGPYLTGLIWFSFL